MPYGEIKVDNITFTNVGADQATTVSGIYRAITSGVTVTGTISGATIQGATVSGTAGIFGAGSAAAPSISFTSDPNTGIYSPAADTLAFVEGGVEVLRIDSNGRVGIGTSSPTAKLHVETVPQAISQSGSVLFGPNVDYGFEVRNVIDGSGFPRVELRAPTAGNGPMLFFAGGATERLRIDSSGRVGIGTTSPGYPLDVVSDSSAWGLNIRGRSADNIAYIRFSPNNGATTYAAIGAPSANTLGFDVNGSERLRIDSSGNVGIGTSSPTSTLQVGPGNTSSNTARAVFNTNDVAGRSGIVISNWTGSATTNGPRIAFDNSTRGVFEIGGADGADAFVVVDLQASAERLRIDSSGRLLVGTSSERTNVYYTTFATTPKVQFETVGSSFSNGLSLIHYSSTGYPPVLTLGSSSSATQGTQVALSNSFDMGAIQFTGSDGTNFRTGATIVATNDQAASWAVGDCPTRLVFSTTADGAASPTERFRIGSSGQLGVGGANYGTSGQVLTSQGPSATPAWTTLLTVPAGAVIYFAMSAAPTGFLKANGAAISRTTYANLFAAIGTTFGVGDGSSTFNVPDLRGEFVRGWDDGRGVDSGRSFASAQSFAMQEVTGGITTSADGNAGYFTGSSGAFTISAGGNRIVAAGGASSASYNRFFSFSLAQGGAQTATETRPRNIALLACIKF